MGIVSSAGRLGRFRLTVSYCTAGVCVATWVPCPVRHGVRTYNRVELVSSLITTEYFVAWTDRKTGETANTLSLYLLHVSRGAAARRARFVRRVC